MQYVVQKGPSSIALVATIILSLGVLASCDPIASNEQHASEAIRKIQEAVVAFRKDDADGNQVQDYWTADVTGLHTYGVLPKELAEADAAPLKPLVPTPKPYHGYYFIALEGDDTVMPPNEVVNYDPPPRAYRKVTDQKGEKVHNYSYYGFCAYPAEYGKSGKQTFVVYEEGTVYKFDAKGEVTKLLPRGIVRPEVGWSKAD